MTRINRHYTLKEKKNYHITETMSPYVNPDRLNQLCLILQAGLVFPGFIELFSYHVFHIFHVVCQLLPLQSVVFLQFPIQMKNLD